MVRQSRPPTGGFTYLRSFRPHVGKVPINGPVDDPRGHRRWERIVREAEDDQARAAAGQWFLRDMTVFVDDDGTAWHIASSEEYVTLNISKLTDDYLDFTAEFARVLPTQRNEAPRSSRMTAVIT